VAESGNESHAARALCHSSLEGDRCASHVVRESIEVARHAASAAIEHVGGAVKAERLVGAPVISDVGPPIGSLRMATVRYLVRDVDAALPFYQALGFAITERWGPPFVMLTQEDLCLWLSGPGTSAYRPLPDGSVPQSGGWNRLVIEVEDLNISMSALRETGARFRSEPVQGPGGRQVIVEDPSGNPIELFEAKDE
jgi:catechol 2,3-dioxygenase-like lactoylglutathione lyase family enzyme